MAMLAHFWLYSATDGDKGTREEDRNRREEK
jgi:hypothetical protein